MQTDMTFVWNCVSRTKLHQSLYNEIPWTMKTDKNLQEHFLKDCQHKTGRMKQQDLLALQQVIREVNETTMMEERKQEEKRRADEHERMLAESRAEIEKLSAQRAAEKAREEAQRK